MSNIFLKVRQWSINISSVHTVLKRIKRKPGKAFSYPAAHSQMTVPRLGYAGVGFPDPYSVIG